MVCNCCGDRRDLTEEEWVKFISEKNLSLEEINEIKEYNKIQFELK